MTDATKQTVWYQKQIALQPRPRGIHLVTREFVEQLPEVRQIQMGLAHFFIQHTSASLTINENAEPEVRTDLETHFDRLVPEEATHYTHTYEGPDDMPAHIKAVLIGSGVVVPITDGRLNLGTWQGLYLGEHRSRGGTRMVVVTIWGVAA